MSVFSTSLRTSTIIASLALTTLALGISGCGAGGGGDAGTANNGGGSGGGATSIVASGYTLPLHGSLNGYDFWPRNVAPDSVVQGYLAADNTTFFQGKFRFQRLVATQPTTVLPPARLTLKAVDAATGMTLFTTSVPRGTFEPNLDVWGNGASGTWPYSVYVAVGYQMAPGTVVRWYLVDGDGTPASGDNLSGYHIWQGTPFLPSLYTETQPLTPTATPIPAFEISISATG